MSKKEKRIRKLVSLPTDMRFEEVDLILTDHNFELDNVRGSHFIYVNEDQQITFPKHKNKVTKYYLKMIVNKLDLEG